MYTEATGATRTGAWNVRAWKAQESDQGGANGADPSVKLYNGVLGGKGERTAGMRCCAICPNA